MKMKVPNTYVIIFALLVLCAVVFLNTQNTPKLASGASVSSRMGIMGAVFAAPMIALCKEILYFIIYKIKRQDPYPELYR